MLTAPDYQDSPANQRHIEAAVAPAPCPVRIGDPRLQAALLDAARRSPTLQRQLARLTELSAIVYVEWTIRLPRLVEAVTERQVIATPAVRYTRVFVQHARITDHLLSVLAHEFHHVLEGLEAGVVDRSSRERPNRPGSGGTAMQVYETSAAIEVGLAVARELRDSTHPGR